MDPSRPLKPSITLWAEGGIWSIIFLICSFVRSLVTEMERNVCTEKTVGVRSCFSPPSKILGRNLLRSSCQISVPLVLGNKWAPNSSAWVMGIVWGWLTTVGNISWGGEIRSQGIAKGAMGCCNSPVVGLRPILGSSTRNSPCNL